MGKHLNLSQRILIEGKLNKNLSLRKIGEFIEQGTDLDSYSQEQINLMINHINNTKRKKLDGNTPYNLMVKKFGMEPIKKLGFYFIQPKDIILNPSLFKDNNKEQA